MFYKNTLFILFLYFFSNCTTNYFNKNKPNKFIVNGYSNKGFALIYSEDLYKKK